MREISCEQITNAIEGLCMKACTMLPPETAMLIDCAVDTEESPTARGVLQDLCENFTYAGLNELPICQDTGMAVIFAEIGQEVHITGGLFADAVNEGVRRGYVLLRKSVVRDPLRRVNTGDNTPAVIHTELEAGDKLRLTLAPKGFGSEHMSAMTLFLPSADKSEVIDFIVETADKAGSNPCPPIIMGVGLGGTIEQAALLSKRALCRPMDKRNSDEFYADLEREALRRVNDLGIGPQGFGGLTTALAVHIETYPTHIATMPVGVTLNCHAARHKQVVL